MRGNTSVIKLNEKEDNQLVFEMEWNRAFPKFENFLNCQLFNFVALCNSLKIGHYLLGHTFVAW